MCRVRFLIGILFLSASAVGHAQSEAIARKNQLWAERLEILNTSSKAESSHFVGSAQLTEFLAPHFVSLSIGDHLSAEDKFLSDLCDDGLVTLPASAVFGSKTDTYVRAALSFFSLPSGSLKRSQIFNLGRAQLLKMKLGRRMGRLQALANKYIRIRVDEKFTSDSVSGEGWTEASHYVPGLKTQKVTPHGQALNALNVLVGTPSATSVAELPSAIQRLQENGGRPIELELALGQAVRKGARSREEEKNQDEVIGYLLGVVKTSAQVSVSSLINPYAKVGYVNRISQLLKEHLEGRLTITDLVPLVIQIDKALTSKQTVVKDELRQIMAELSDSQALKGQAIGYNDFRYLVDARRTALLNRLKEQKVKALVDTRREGNPNPPMVRAFQEGRADIAEALLGFLDAADINLPSIPEGRSPVALAVIRAIERNDKVMFDFVMDLYAAGHISVFDMNATDALGLAPIHYAAAACSYVIARDLIAAGALANLLTGSPLSGFDSTFLNENGAIVLPYPVGNTGSVAIHSNENAKTIGKRCERATAPLDRDIGIFF